MVTKYFPAIVRFGYVAFQRQCGDVGDANWNQHQYTAKPYRKRSRMFMAANSSDGHSTVHRGKSYKELHTANQNTDHRAKLNGCYVLECQTS
jgi:hypothetical protein